MDWLLNPYDIGYLGWVLFILILIGGIAASIVGALSALWASRERRDGKR